MLAIQYRLTTDTCMPHCKQGGFGVSEKLNKHVLDGLHISPTLKTNLLIVNYRGDVGLAYQVPNGREFSSMSGGAGCQLDVEVLIRFAVGTKRALVYDLQEEAFLKAINQAGLKARRIQDANGCAIIDLPRCSSHV